MKDQDSALHPLDAALFLVSRPLEPAIHRHDLRHLEALGVHDSLRPWTLLAGVQLRHPDAQRLVGSPKPFQRGLGEEVGSDPRRQRHRSFAPGQPPSGGRADRERKEQRQHGHPRNHPLRRNQK